MNRDVAILADGREIPVADIPAGELPVWCARGQIKAIRHFTAPRSKNVGGFRKPTPKPMTASQRACVEGDA